MTEQEEAKCNKCDEVFPCTTEFFYSCKGKLKTSICKECKKIQSREYAKSYIPKKPRKYVKGSRNEYMKEYNKLHPKKETRTYQDRKEYQREYQRKYIKEYRLKKKALLSVQE